jgi:hypothetical protein
MGFQPSKAYMHHMDRRTVTWGHDNPHVFREETPCLIMSWAINNLNHLERAIIFRFSSVGTPYEMGNYSTWTSFTMELTLHIMLGISGKILQSMDNSFIYA